ncbi:MULTISPECIES: phycobilisome rod-core linker polypeptide [unclassified Microcoleus]|uniref:phycobilisome rod-core linker polypeptide n=1 Tax=unclassified Microcoleus TaxID=2642155 RepID=UPI0025DEBCE5|nr:MULTISPECIES: phycobilisome rod-core linker polypeptide [unclassified Microcoleus]
MADSTKCELWQTSGADEVQAVIRAVYKQVLGNPHVMESERLVTAESQLCDRSISVREFVRLVAKSDFYSTRYFQKCAPYRFVELNFLHLLGRAPQDQTEISEHIIRCVEQGYSAEIDSYLDSDEYQTAFGENVVPYYRGRSSEANTKQLGYNRMSLLDRGFAQIDSAVKASQLVYAVATNSANAIKPSTSRGGAYVATEKMFKIVVTGSKFDRPRRLSNTTYIVAGDNMTPQIQRINRTSGKIVSITEIL